MCFWITYLVPVPPTVPIQSKRFDCKKSIMEAQGSLLAGRVLLFSSLGLVGGERGPRITAVGARSRATGMARKKMAETSHSPTRGSGCGKAAKMFRNVPSRLRGSAPLPSPLGTTRELVHGPGSRAGRRCYIIKPFQVYPLKRASGRPRTSTSKANRLPACGCSLSCCSDRPIEAEVT